MVRYPPFVPSRFVGDGERIRQVVTNLAGNAVKFTASGHVLISAECTGVEHAGDSPEAEMRISVTDTGIGISMDKLGLLFEKFAQADASTTRKYGGTGLGLAISKQLVELMGGVIGAESEPERGSKFWFSLRLPRGRPRPHLLHGWNGRLRCAITYLLHLKISWTGIRRRWSIAKQCRCGSS